MNAAAMLPYPSSGGDEVFGVSAYLLTTVWFGFFFWLGSVNLLLFPKIMAPSTLEQKHKFVEAAR